MTPVERELLVLVARHVAGHIAPSVGAERMRALAVQVEAQAPGAVSATVTQADLRAVLTVVADVAGLLAIAAVDADATAGVQAKAWELRDTARRMAATLPERTA